MHYRSFGCSGRVAVDKVFVEQNFMATPTSGLEPLTVQFTDTSANFRNITSWFWDFGDGTNSTMQNPTHVYRQDGNYTVSLTVVGDGIHG